VSAPRPAGVTFFTRRKDFDFVFLRRVPHPCGLGSWKGGPFVFLVLGNRGRTRRFLTVFSRYCRLLASACIAVEPPTVHRPKNAVQPRIPTIRCKTLYLSANEMLPFPMFSSQSSQSSSPSRHFSLLSARSLQRVNCLLLSPFSTTLTDHLQLVENAITLSPVLAALTSRVKHNPCVCHSYKKHPGWGSHLQIKMG
jgi:hypothetical protein